MAEGMEEAILTFEQHVCNTHRPTAKRKVEDAAECGRKTFLQGLPSVVLCGSSSTVFECV
jgi:hypothetical protein